MHSRKIFICGMVALCSASPTSPPEFAHYYYSDQQQEKAFKVFLDSLQTKPSPDEYCATEEELQLYRAALAIYLEAKGANRQEASQQILTHYVPILESIRTMLNLPILSLRLTPTKITF